MKAKKNLGQNFLIDKNITNKIIDSMNFDIKENIIEVGPGKGDLTKYIYPKVNNIFAFEIDDDLIPVLENQKINNLKIYNVDFLKFNIENFLIEHKEIKTFIANLPYYISTKILFRIIEQKQITKIGVMLQKELVDRIFAKPNSKEYGRLTVAINSLFLLDSRIEVSKNSFTPKPKVDSSFFIINRKKDFSIDINKYLIFIKFCFANKRKTLLNSLKNNNKIYYEKVLTFFKNNNFSSNIRAEQLTINQFIDIYSNISN